MPPKQVLGAFLFLAHGYLLSLIAKKEPYSFRNKSRICAGYEDVEEWKIIGERVRYT